MADALENAYAAGFFDGEGCVQLYMRKHPRPTNRQDNSFRCALSISSTDMDPLGWLQERWRGAVSIDQRTLYGVRKPLGRWIVFSEQADVFAADIYPYLIIKKKQMELWLQARAMMYRRGHMPGGLPEEEADLRREMVYRMKELKRCG